MKQLVGENASIGRQVKQLVEEDPSSGMTLHLL